MTPEGKIEDHLKKQVKATDGEYRKLKWIARNGAPDRFVFWPGVSAFIEVKKPGEQPTIQQAREHARLRAAGLNVYVVDSELSVDLTISLLTETSKHRKVSTEGDAR